MLGPCSLWLSMIAPLGAVADEGDITDEISERNDGGVAEGKEGFKYDAQQADFT